MGIEQGRTGLGPVRYEDPGGRCASLGEIKRHHARHRSRQSGGGASCVRNSERRTKPMRSRLKIVCVVFLAMALATCKAKEAATTSSATDTTGSTSTVTTMGETAFPVQKIEATPEAVQRAQEDLQAAADRDRRMYAALTF